MVNWVFSVPGVIDAIAVSAWVELHSSPFASIDPNAAAIWCFALIISNANDICGHYIGPFFTRALVHLCKFAMYAQPFVD